MPRPAKVDIVAVLLQRDDRYLAAYSPTWGSFTPPMTKRRHLDDPEVFSLACDESWADAATRAVAECLGKTGLERPEFVAEIPLLQRSQRSGKVQRYRIQVFRLVLKEVPALAPGLAAEWLTADEFLDEHRQPISPTARELFAELRVQSRLQ